MQIIPPRYIAVTTRCAIVAFWWLWFSTIHGAAAGQTLAYWRFEDGAAGSEVMPDAPIRDVHNGHNALQTFSSDTAPSYTATVPFDIVPQTGQANRVAIDNTARPGRRVPTRDLFTVHGGSGIDLNNCALPRWTIEASILFKPVENWERRFQTFVGRDGYNIPNGPAINEDPLANLGFKKRGDTNVLSIEAWDSARKYVGVRGNEPVQADVWYHVAAVSDGTTLVLYIKGPSDAEYVKQNEAPFDGALFNAGEGWTVGRGCFAYYPSEQFLGLIDEVRISAVALEPRHFLASPKTSEPPPTTVPVVMAAPGAAANPAPPDPPMPKTLIHPHDPALLKAGDMYHAFASHDGIAHWQSSDLIHWEQLPGVFAQPPEWATQEIAERPGLWAPDVAFFNGRYHLYYSVSRFGSQRSAIGLVANDSLDPKDPTFAWKEQGKVVESNRGDDFNAIDPAVTIDAQGKPWLSWGSFNKGIYLSRLDSLTGKLADAEAKPHHVAARPGNTALEAPHLFFHDGWYYLIISNDFCCRGARSSYKLMVGRAKEITGPYHDRDGKPMLEGNATLLLRSYRYHRGPGHTSMVEKDAKQYLAHHYYDARQNGIPTLAVRPLYWDEAGWPLMGEPIAELYETAAASADLAGKWYANEDYGQPNDAFDLAFDADGAVRGPRGRGRWVLEGSSLKITWPADSDGADASDQCFVAGDGNSFVGRRSDGKIIHAVRWPSGEK